MEKSASENQVYVYVDYESSGVWMPSESGGIACYSYAYFHLPKELVQRFDYWTSWFSNRRPEKEDVQNRLDSKLFNAYGLSLASELKLFLKDSYRVFYIFGMRKNPLEIILVERDYDNDVVPVAKESAELELTSSK